jgi:hypothetical protein
MSTQFAARPQFFLGEYLGADDLEALVTYFHQALARHQLGSHAWGIAAGIDIVYATSPLGDVEAWLSPGIAIDGYGRTIVVTEPFPLDAGLFAGQAAGLVNVWIRHTETSGSGVRPGFEVCGVTDAFARVVEAFLVEVGERKSIDARQAGVALGADVFPDAREAPGWLLPQQPLTPDGSVPAQRFPTGDEPDLWLVPVGRVLWQGGLVASPTQASAKQSRIFRRYAGWIGEALYGSGGLLRLGARQVPRVNGSSTDQVCDALLPVEADLVYCAGHPESPAFREPIWLDADTRARGHVRLYGTRTEWVDRAGTDYLASPPGCVTALRRTAPSALMGVDLEMLLGVPQPLPATGPTRLTIGAAVAAGNDPCNVDFTYTAHVAVDHAGHVGIGSTDKPLTLPLTIRATGADGVLAGFDNGAGTLAWQVGLGAGGGLNVTQADATKTDLFVAPSGDVGLGTQTPGARLDIQRVPSPLGNPVGTAKWLQMGASGAGDLGQAWFQYGPQLAPLLVLSDLDDPARIQFQQIGGGTEGAAQFASWIGMARGGSPDLAIIGGNFGIGTVTPAAPLEVRGAVRLGPAGNYFAVGGVDDMRMLAGVVAEAGASAGSGWSASWSSTGHCDIVFPTAFTAVPVVVATTIDASDDDNLPTIRNLGVAGCTVVVKDMTPPLEGDYVNTRFSFIAYGPRP